MRPLPQLSQAPELQRVQPPGLLQSSPVVSSGANCTAGGRRGDLKGGRVLRTFRLGGDMERQGQHRTDQRGHEQFLQIDHGKLLDWTQLKLRRHRQQLS